MAINEDPINPALDIKKRSILQKLIACIIRMNGNYVRLIELERHMDDMINLGALIPGISRKNNEITWHLNQNSYREIAKYCDVIEKFLNMEDPITITFNKICTSCDSPLSRIDKTDEIYTFQCPSCENIYRFKVVQIDEEKFEDV